jgi:hypothetical protein
MAKQVSSIDIKRFPPYQPRGEPGMATGLKTWSAIRRMGSEPSLLLAWDNAAFPGARGFGGRQARGPAVPEMIRPISGKGWSQNNDMAMTR